METAKTKKIVDQDLLDQANKSANSDKNSKKSQNPVLNRMGRSIDNVKKEVPIHLDPSMVDPSIAKDRFEPDEDTRSSLAALVESIRETGQHQPALVRPHPEKKGRYQLAYGHRRLEAIKSIAEDSGEPNKWKFKAIVKELTDEELLLLQTSENSERENLTWIESAMWAQKLTENCSIPQKKLAIRIGTNESGISRMLAVVRSIPHDIIESIGRAPTVGQPRWSSFSKLIAKDEVAEFVREKINSKDFEALKPNEKFELAFKAARGTKSESSGKKGKPIQKRAKDVYSSDGRRISTVNATKSEVRFSIPNSESSFASWLQDQLPQLFDDYMSSPKSNKS